MKRTKSIFVVAGMLFMQANMASAEAQPSTMIADIDDQAHGAAVPAASAAPAPATDQSSEAVMPPAKDTNKHKKHKKKAEAAAPTPAPSNPTAANNLPKK